MALSLSQRHGLQLGERVQGAAVAGRRGGHLRQAAGVVELIGDDSSSSVVLQVSRRLLDWKLYSRIKSCWDTKLFDIVSNLQPPRRRGGAPLAGVAADAVQLLARLAAAVPLLRRQRRRAPRRGRRRGGQGTVVENWKGFG